MRRIREQKTRIRGGSSTNVKVIDRGLGSTQEARREKKTIGKKAGKTVRYRPGGQEDKTHL